LALLAGISMPVLATEVYHWVDENGVAHYSQHAPAADVAGVSKMILEDTTPPDYDPEEDRYGVEAQAAATDRAGPNISLQTAWSKPELIPVFWRL
jgi:hypothetical protein